jgi:hypothetical protein
MNCFTCHVKARPEFDFFLRAGSGCDPIPVTRAISARCKGPIRAARVRSECRRCEALRQLGELVKASTEKSKRGSARADHIGSNTE